MKSTTKRVFGILLILFASLSLLAAVCQVLPYMYIDFPCFGQQLDKNGVSAETRLAYCISLRPRNAISGATIYAIGSSNQDQATAGALRLQRDVLTLRVNGHAVNPGEVYKTTRYAPFSPWVVLTSRFEIRNDGLMSDQPTAPGGVLFVSGNVVEGWLPSPLGPALLILGIWLVRKAKKERKGQSIEAGHKEVPSA